MKEIFSNDPQAKTWMLLVNTSHVVLKARERELRQYSISAIKSVVLVLIHAMDNNLTPAQLSRQILRDAHTVSELLTRMETEGLIRKVRDLPRKNQVRITLTDKGYEAYNKTIKRESIHDIISVLSSEEQRQMMSYLKRIRTQALKHLK